MLVKYFYLSCYDTVSCIFFVPPSFPRRFSAVKCWRWKTGGLFLERRSTDGGHIMRGSLVPQRVTWLFNPIISYGLFTRKQFVCLLHGTLVVNPRRKMCRFRQEAILERKMEGVEQWNCVRGVLWVSEAIPRGKERWRFEAKRAWWLVRVSAWSCAFKRLGVVVYFGKPHWHSEIDLKLSPVKAWWEKNIFFMNSHFCRVPS